MYQLQIVGVLPAFLGPMTPPTAPLTQIYLSKASHTNIIDCQRKFHWFLGLLMFYKNPESDYSHQDLHMTVNH